MPISFIDDLVSGCGFSADDEPVYKDLLLKGQNSKCEHFGQLPCKIGHTRCFNISEICLYKLDIFNHIIPCRTGEHLENCEIFECNMKYKCPDYYCIPYSYICNGKWDCPGGYDEAPTHNCVSRQCKSMFKCKSSQICIHPADSCDTIKDCPFGDDEVMCDIQHTCPSFCVCFHYGVACKDIHINQEDLMKLPYIVYYIFRTRLQILEFAEQNSHIKILKVSNNDISEICTSVSKIHSSKRLDVSFSSISLLSPGSFNQLKHLVSIDVTNNILSTVKSKALKSLHGIMLIIDLSNNKIETIVRDTFVNVTKFHMLRLVNNLIMDMSLHMFDSMKISILVTDDFHLCCIAPAETICKADVPWYTTCQRLFPGKLMRISFLLISCIVFLANSLSLFLNIIKIKRSKGQTYNLIVCFINAGDIMCGLYLAVIYVADIIFKDSFIISDVKWRRSSGCIIAFVLALTFSLTIPYFLTYLSMARLMVVVNPFNTKFKSKSFVARCLLGGICLFDTSGVVVALFLHDKGTMPSNLCSPFINPTDSVKISTWVVFIAQFVALVLISLMYIILIKQVIHNSKELAGSPN